MRMKLSRNNNFNGLCYLAIVMSLACFGDGVWYDDDCLDRYCGEPPLCPEEVPQRQWVVTNSSHAQTLAEAVRCSVGVFEVEWDGSVVIKQTFVVVNGTVLNVYGSGPDAEIDGNGITRIFTVANASLSLSNITLASGNATSGGAIAAINSTLSFRQTTFYGNIASSNGGALLVSNGSSASFDDFTTFWNNMAGENGGALYVSGGRVSTWLGNAMFLNNIAANGGAIFATGESNISLRGDTVFHGNVANSGFEGGGGGAIFVGDGAEVEWAGVTNFTSNTASWYGGAVSAKSWISTNPVSRILMRGPTYFFNNRCGGNGGGISLRALSSVSFGAMGVTFSGNSADLAGGAFFITETGSETALSGVAFKENFAQVGGAVYTCESQSTVTIDGCDFVGNVASFSGGAMENAGRVSCAHTSFIRNEAAIGGALRLIGTTSLHNSMFLENISEEGGGAAVSNMGIMSTLFNITFGHNLYTCDPGSYLNFDGFIIEGICNGCPPCNGCVTESSSPICLEELEHTSSYRPNTSIESLLIDPGYWRATNTSRIILPCYVPGACIGGLTGSSGYCAQGYEGPYCSVCSEGYREGRDRACIKCSDSSSGNLHVITICLAVVGIVFASYKLWETMELRFGGFVKRLVRHVPFQSIKIIIVTWQILRQFTSSMNISYTDIYNTFLDIIAAFNFDLGSVISLDCIVELDFDKRMLLSTLGPNAVLALLGMSYTIAVIRHRESETSLRNIRDKHLEMVLLVTFLVYASVSSVLFPMFSCEILDDGKSYLRADYAIQCDSTKHRSLQIYAAFMILLYPVGVPVFYSWLLFRNRDVLMDGASREDNPRVQSISDLWEAYKSSRFYYEIIECIRRLAITLTIVMIYPGTAAQLSVTIMVTFGFGILTEALDPYDSPWDTWMNRAGYAIDFSSMFYASQLKVDILAEYNSTSRHLDVTLVVANACMILAVVIRGLWSVTSSRVYELDGPITELRRNDTRVRNEVTLVCVENLDDKVRRDVV